MHEQSLMADLMRKLESLSRDQGGKKIMQVKVKLGALSHISADHFREHFEHSSRASCAENACLEVEVSEDINDPNAQEILLQSIEVEE